MKTTALIPARLKSKRFPNKLIKKINGTPIILKTYRAAIDTGFLIMFMLLVVMIRYLSLLRQKEVKPLNLLKITIQVQTELLKQ